MQTSIAISIESVCVVVRDRINAPVVKKTVLRKVSFMTSFRKTSNSIVPASDELTEIQYNIANKRAEFETLLCKYNTLRHKLSEDSNDVEMLRMYQQLRQMNEDIFHLKRAAHKMML